MKRNRSRQDAVVAVRSAVLRQGLIPPKSRVLVACSGGPDSTALLHILLELGREAPFDLAVAHFNHRLRPSAEADERFVRDSARALGLPIAVGRRNVRAYAASRKLNLEEAARELRYAFLERSAARMKADLIATGHTLNDQAETLLMRLLRGSGPRGLSGISPMVGGRLVRPLLGVTRSEIAAFLRERRLPFLEDETNRDRRLLRNRIRWELIPYLERGFEPQAVRALGRSARIIQDEDAVLEAAARRAYARLAHRVGGDIRLDAAGLDRLPAGSGRRVVRAYLKDLRGDLRRLTFDDFEAVRTLKEGAIRVLPGGMRIGREANRIREEREGRQRGARKRTSAYSWDGRAALSIPEAGWTLRGKRFRAGSGSTDFDDRTRGYCDAASLRFPLTVSSRRPGDRYRPLGAPGAKKLKEILRAKGISRDVRGDLPVIRSENEIVWVPGLPVGERFKVTAETKTVFAIEAVRISGPVRPAPSARHGAR